MFSITRHFVTAMVLAGCLAACSDSPNTSPTGPASASLARAVPNSGGSVAPACGTVTKYSTNVGARDGYATVQASINLAAACPTGGIGIIKVTIMNDVTGVSADMWDGTFLSPYGFTATYLTADFSTPYTITVVASGVTTTLPSVTTLPVKL